ncbi:NUDIX domain-containing protein [Sphingobacterium siyangense subsp. cladoniae]|uniref:NUDIX hydrolase n=1 Tax=Sphingobacterium siyangense TaxID=459529 RepID=UPI0031F7400D
MDLRTQIINASAESYEKFLPHISVDTVVFGFDQGSLRILLLKMNYNKEWFLPGGYVGKEEDTDQAVKRVLYERSGVKDIFLEEFAVFGNPQRSQQSFADYPDTLWNKQRFISIGYYALVNYKHVVPQPDSLSETCQWIDFKDITELNITMDHRKIISKALQTLRERLSYKPIGYNLLPDKFTLSDLQGLYETVLGKKLNRGNFYRKMKNMGILQKLDEQRKGGAHKAPDLYKFNVETYNNILQEGLNTW